eukprot:scaffold198673_cov19-Tisochrysis_lutea.AAC.1
MQIDPYVPHPSAAGQSSGRFYVFQSSHLCPPHAVQSNPLCPSQICPTHVMQSNPCVPAQASRPTGYQGPCGAADRAHGGNPCVPA